MNKLEVILFPRDSTPCWFGGAEYIMYCTYSIIRQTNINSAGNFILIRKGLYLQYSLHPVGQSISSIDYRNEQEANNLICQWKGSIEMELVETVPGHPS